LHRSECPLCAKSGHAAALLCSEVDLITHV